MAGFRGRPAIVDAVMVPPTHFPAWLLEALDTDIVRICRDGTAEVETARGLLTAQVGDWLVYDAERRIYPIKPNRFVGNQEKV